MVSSSSGKEKETAVSNNNGCYAFASMSCYNGESKREKHWLLLECIHYMYTMCAEESWWCDVI